MFAGLGEAILSERHHRDWQLTTPLVQAEAHEVLARKFPYLPQAQALFDANWSQAICVHDLDEPADDRDVRLVKAANLAGVEVFVAGHKRVLSRGCEGAMQILRSRSAWMQLFAGNDRAGKSANVGRASDAHCAAQLYAGGSSDRGGPCVFEWLGGVMPVVSLQRKSLL